MCKGNLSQCLTHDITVSLSKGNLSQISILMIRSEQLTIVQNVLLEYFIGSIFVVWIYLLSLKRLNGHMKQ